LLTTDVASDEMLKRLCHKFDSMRDPADFHWAYQLLMHTLQSEEMRRLANLRQMLTVRTCEKNENIFHRREAVIDW
jgi:hypothetical protein